jgi:hypothetical protein
MCTSFKINFMFHTRGTDHEFAVGNLRGFGTGCHTSGGKATRKFASNLSARLDRTNNKTSVTNDPRIALTAPGVSAPSGYAGIWGAPSTDQLIQAVILPTELTRLVSLSSSWSRAFRQYRICWLKDKRVELTIGGACFAPRLEQRLSGHIYRGYPQPFCFLPHPFQFIIQCHMLWVTDNAAR